ncbi:hypothetical protein CKX34_12685 [Neisseria gonorrhoeae]|nr:hypothetical protein CKX34_12685 [Neisseria gonorrhoeae]
MTANLFKRIVRFFAAAEAADELKSIARNVGNIERYLRQAEGILYNFATLFNKTDYRYPLCALGLALFERQTR